MSDTQNMYLIENKEGASVVKKLEIPELGDGGQQGWALQQYSKYGVDYIMLIAEKDAAVYPIHKAPDAFFGFVAEGFGKAYQSDAEGNVSTSIDYKQGDIILFDPDTNHGWKSESETSKLLFFKASK